MASTVDTSVKYITSDMPGAPVLNGVIGALVALTDACLNTGFGLRAVTSLVVAGGVATLTVANDVKNGNLLHSVVLVDGVTGPLVALNGEQKLTAVSSTQLKFATAAADGTATGTITIKQAPLGFDKVFSGTNTAVYRSANVLGTRMFVRLSDTVAQAARIVGYESMSDVDTGVGPFPTPAQMLGGGMWPRVPLQMPTPFAGRLLETLVGSFCLSRATTAPRPPAFSTTTRKTGMWATSSPPAQAETRSLLFWASA